MVIIGFAFSAGAVAFLNPCGFAMLPTYVSYFVESNTQNIITASSNSRLILVKRLARAGSVGLLVTAAFIVTFGLTVLPNKITHSSLLLLFIMYLA
ncbi:MAG: hypothetical protein WA667_18735 [Candidatus Nitrosopolaris sp.]